MYRGLRCAVVIPAFNEEGKISAAVRSVPDFVDHTIVVDDASRDETGRRAADARGGRDHMEIVRHA